MDTFVTVELTVMTWQTLAVLNPLGRIDQHLMDDSDLAGPILFFLLFGTFLLFVSASRSEAMKQFLTVPHSLANCISATYMALRSSGRFFSILFSPSCHHLYRSLKDSKTTLREHRHSHPHSLTPGQHLSSDTAFSRLSLRPCLALLRPWMACSDTLSRAQLSSGARGAAVRCSVRSEEWKE